MFFIEAKSKYSVSKLNTAKTKGFLFVLILTVSLLIPFFKVQPASAEPEQLSLKWTGYVAGGGEDLLTADVLTDASHPGEEIFHAGGAVAPNSGGRVTCLNGRTGAQIWTRTITNVGDTCQIHMVDMDNNGDLEIVVPIQMPAGIYILHAEDGSIMFSDTTLGGGRMDSSPISGDVDGDGYPDLYFGVMAYETQPSTGKIIHYEYNGASIVERRRVQVWHPCAGGLSLCDTDNDGTVELYMNERDVYFGDGGWGRGTVSFWAENLTVRWQLYGWGASSNIPMLADVNKDGIVDVVTTDLSRSVCVLNSTDGHPLTNNVGTVLSGQGSGERRNHYQSSIYDFDGDGNIEVASGDGFEGGYNYVTVFDLWDWTLDAMIDTTVAGGRSWKGPTFGDVTGDARLEMLVVTFDHLGNGDEGTLQVYNQDYELVHLNTGLRHRAIDAVVQDVDLNDGGLNEVLVLTQGGVIYCFEASGHASVPRARSEVQFYSESRNGASAYVPYVRPYSDVMNAFPTNGAINISTGLSSLRFTLDHPNGELMDYVVTADFGISSASGNNVGDGQRTVAVNGLLASNTVYHWQVTVTDDSGHVTVKDYSFTTGPYLPNSAPTQTTPSLAGETILNDLTATAQGTGDADGDSVTNIYNWQKNGVSIANLNLAFDTQTDPEDEYSGLATTRDYAFGATGQVFGATWVPNGKVGGAYSFDGDDFIRVHETGTSNRYDGGGSRSEMSLECWVKATVTTGTERLIWKQDYYDDEETGQPMSYRLDYRNTGSRLEFTWQVAIGPLGGEGEYTTYTLGPYYVTSGVSDWHHIVCTYKSGVGLRLYVDGAEVSSRLGSTYTGNILNTDGPLDIAFNSGSDFAGLLDEVRLYPFEISHFMVNQRYLDTKDGLSSSSTVSKYELQVGQQWRCQVTPNDGLTDGSTLTTATRTISDATNMPPSASNLAITPASPVTGDDLVANYSYSDPEGHPEYGSVISWYLNGDFVATGALLPSSLTEKGESWTFTVIPSDGFDLGTTTGPSNPVTILNTIPSFTSIVITPNPAFAGNSLTANCYGWSDPDADAAEAYTYRWQKLVSAVWQDIGGATSKTLSAVNFVRGDHLKVIVTANDGESLGNTIEAQTWIVDSDPPTTGTPVLVSGSGSNSDDDELTCTPVNTQDAEGDDVTIVYNWLRNGMSYTNLLLPFDTNSTSTAVDYSGYGNHGMVYGATNTAGVIGGAYSFDGNDYIAVQENSNSLGGDGTWSQISVEFWVKASGATTSTQTVVFKSNTSYAPGSSLIGSYRAQYRYYADSYRVYFYFSDGTVENSVNARIYENPLEWHHVVLTYQSGVGLNIYTDGLLRESLAATGNIGASLGGLLYLGGVNSGSTDFSGLLDEVKIYPTAISAAQVFQNYADGADGLNNSATIVPKETSSGQTWRCRVTPNDGWQDGTPALSNQLTITSANTRPHIDWYSPVESQLYVNIGNSIEFKQVSSDPNGSLLTYNWTLDLQQKATTQDWTYVADSASLHVVRVTISDGTSTDYQEWNVNVIEPTGPFNLHVEVNGQGITNATGDNFYDDGTSVIAQAAANSGWHFDYWLLNNTNVGSVNPYTLTMNANYNLTAVFTENPPQYMLHVEIVGSGTTNATGDTLYDAGTIVHVLAIAGPDYEFSYWLLNATNYGYTNQCSVTLNANYNLTAVFTPQTPTQHIFKDGFESGNFNAWNGTTTTTGASTDVVSSPVHSGSYSAQFGITTGIGTRRAYAYKNLDSLSEVYATAYVYIADGLPLVSGEALWLVQFQDNAGNPLGSFGIRADESGTHWALQYAGWPYALADASVPAPLEGAWYKVEVFFTHASTGKTLTLAINDEEVVSMNQDTSAANAIAGARFGIGYWIGSSAVNVNVDDVVIDSETVPEVNYGLVIEVQGSGTTDPAVGTYQYNEGTIANVFAEPASGWQFSNWLLNGTDYGSANPCAITMDAKCSLTAIFTEIPPVQYQLHVETSGSGTTNATGNNMHNAGTNVTIQASANAGWTFSHWLLNDTNVGSINPYTVTMNANYNLTAVFNVTSSTTQDCLVVRGTDNNLYYRTYNGAIWSDWSVIPGQTMYEPAAAIYDGKLHVAIVGTMYNALYWGSVNLTTGEFSGWTWIEGASDSTPALAASDEGLSLVVRGTDNNLYYRTYEGATWSNWQVISGQTNYEPAAAIFDGKLQVAIVGPMYNALYWGNVNLTTGEFSGWTWIEGASDSTPALAATENELCLVVRGTDDLLYYRSFDGSTWSPIWSMIPGETLYEPAAVGFGNRLDLAIVGTMYNAIYYGSVNLTTDEFSGWTWIQGASDSTPALA